MITGAQIIDQALKWKDTPFHYQGRKRGVGVDCVGLAIGPLKELGAIDWDYFNYSNPPNPEELMHLVEEHCTKLDEFEVGALLVFSYKHHAYHTGLYLGNNRVLEASRNPSVYKVVEHGIDDRLHKKIMGIYRLPGVE